MNNEAHVHPAQFIINPDRSCIFDKVAVSFADSFPENHYGLVLGKDGKTPHPALIGYLEKANAEFADCLDIHLEITAVNSRNGEFAVTANNVRSLGANIRVRQQDGR